MGISSKGNKRDAKIKRELANYKEVNEDHYDVYDDNNHEKMKKMKNSTLTC